ncbi:IPT/TIG domain-containing protein [Sphingobacterium spiritivorum]|uniref:NHL repeat protein n=1 Tax=Sphingobacterium spiritivorum ATCC 33861 TaxID=525373 RepID=D7VNV3_SPHSI|nr:IPT/TIG domain-containing protein [Sphingobacterium spiritivorum]EFK57600.1 NHL repeat protein [Sphingobacterium spiritivorum ATCC 33861]QQT36351.1 IPT/TIG domain-containing protein [Sphingobacterium spiritivorum]WQD33096.1 IPT/TIG domain-containing protein [Sphingobacterium spiritivorum]SUJ18695.1 Streptogramin lyase [Sphingobacterium spiritivorum]
MNCYLLTACSFVVALFFSGCESKSELEQKAYDPNKPVVLTSFYPMEGGAKDKILLDGENFGSDPGKIKVYFNNAQASVISSSGERIYAIVPRLPGDDPKISVVIGKDSVVYNNSFTYHIQAQVSTVTGTGDKNFLAGPLDQAHVYGKYLDMDAQGNLFMTWRDGGSFGIARINEKENIVTPLYSAASSPNPYANGVTVDRATGIMTVSHESVAEVFFSFDPREAWILRQRNAQFSAADYGSIVQADRYANFVTFCPYDGHLYTRFRDGKVAKINPVTYAATIVHQGPYGSQYGQAINPAKPWELYITLHSNASPNTFAQGISVLDLRDPNGTGGFKRINAPGGSGFRDGPVADAVFNFPKDIKFDRAGNMFIADYGNHCIRMLSADGIVSTVAGQPTKAGYKDGGPVESQFNQPWGVAVNDQGDIYIADWNNARIRKLVIE